MPDRRRRRSAPQWNSLVAAAEVMTSSHSTLRRSYIGRPEKWQSDAWDFYDEVGELRFGVQWISNAMSRVNLVVGMSPVKAGDEPIPVDYDDPRTTPVQRRAIELLDVVSNGAAGQGQMLGSFGTHLSVAGVAWLVAEPDLHDPGSDTLTDWEVYSSDELKVENTGEISVRVGSRDWRPLHANALVVRVWRRHPRRSYDADSPTHGVLGVLREIVMLQQHIHASAQSRLAGAGILAVPSEAVFPPGQGPQSSRDVDPDDENVQPDEDTFVETLIDSMVTPIGDRGSAAAVVPLVVRIPGEHVDKMTHLRFDTPFDERVLDLLESAIRRLALGMDIPPEILTGTSGMNHWGAWQVQEESITLHIEPLSEIVCHALTIGYLIPALRAEGFSGSEVDEIMVWYDTSDLRTRPDRTDAAIQAYDRQVLSGEALLREMGLSVEDQPTEEELERRVLLDIVRNAPSLAPAILPLLGYDLGEIEVVDVEEVTPVALPEPAGTQGMPDRAAVLAACDMIVLRAMERAGARLRSAAGKNTPGGAAAIDCDDVTLLHCSIDATRHADLGSLLENAWTAVPAVAHRHGIDPRGLTGELDRYARSLLATGQAHTFERLADAVAV